MFFGGFLVGRFIVSLQFSFGKKNNGVGVDWVGG
jgi:hypothetical protein